MSLAWLAWVTPSVCDLLRSRARSAARASILLTERPTILFGVVAFDFFVGNTRRPGEAAGMVRVSEKAK